MQQIGLRTGLGRVMVAGVTALLVAACSDGAVETTVPATSGAPSTAAPPATTEAPSTTLDPITSVGPAGRPAPIDVVPGTPGWFLTANDDGLSLLRPDGVVVPVVDRAVSIAVAASAESIYFQYAGQPGISMLNLSTGRVEPAVDALPGERLVLHGVADGSRGPLLPERWLYYERIAANGDRRLTRWRPGPGSTADLGVIATAGDHVERISYLRGRDFLMIVERAGRREFKAVGWDGEPRALDPEPGSCTPCLPWPCVIATMGCHHLAIGSGRGLVVWVEKIDGRQELVFVQMSPIASEPHREGLPEGTVVDELLLRGSQVIVNTRVGDRAGPALLFDADNKGGFRAPTSARVSWTHDDQMTPLPHATDAGTYVYRSGFQLWMAVAGGGTQLLDDGPVGAFRAGPDHSVFYERIVAPGPDMRQEIWRVDVNTGAKALVLPVPANEFDDLHLEVIAQIDGRHRLGYSRKEWPAEAKPGQGSVQRVLYLTSLDGTEVPERVTAVGGPEWEMDVAVYADGWFVGTRRDIQAASPAAFGVHGEAPSAELSAALRCHQVCDGSNGSSCSTTNGLGCGFGYTISPDGKRLAWIESSHGAARSPFPAVVGHDLVVVDAATGAELARSFIPAVTQGGDGSVSWLGSDRLHVSITRATPSNVSRPVTIASFIARLTGPGAEFSRLVLPDVDEAAPVSV